jgi:hypothetical protein
MADNLIDDLMGELNQNKHNVRHEQHHQQQPTDWNHIADQFSQNESYQRNDNCNQSYNNLQENQQQFFQISVDNQNNLMHPPIININDSLLNQNQIRFLQPVNENGTLVNKVDSNSSDQNFLGNFACPIQTNIPMSNNNNTNSSFLPNEDNIQEKMQQTNFSSQNLSTTKAKKMRKNLKDILKAEPVFQNQNINSSNQHSAKNQSISSIFNNENKYNIANNCSFVTNGIQNVYQMPLNIENFQHIPQVSLLLNSSNDNQVIYNPNIVIILYLFDYSKWSVLTVKLLSSYHGLLVAHLGPPAN